MDAPELMDKAKVFASEHVSVCASELLDWSETAILKDGKVRELARMLRPIAESHALDVARSLIITEALKVAKEARNG